MIEKVAAEKKKRHEELHSLLSDPKVMENKLEYQALARELSGLTPLVNEYNNYLKLATDIKELGKVLEEKELLPYAGNYMRLACQHIVFNQFVERIRHEQKEPFLTPSTSLCPL